MKIKKLKWWAVIFLSLIALLPLKAYADAAPGDKIITLGENLTEEQKNMLLAEFNAQKDVEIVTVSNQEEHKYLGKYISPRLIGSRALSSSAITSGKQGSGLTVDTKNITWVTKEMYINALATAGVKDAEIQVSAPFAVSGTAALTGLIKAYEITADKTIPEDIKQAANEEMVKTATLGDQVGKDKAAALMTKIKEEMAKNPPQNEEDIRTIIEQAAQDLSINLTDQQIQSLLDLFQKLKDLNIDWKGVGEELGKAKEAVSNYLQSEEGQTFLEKLKQFFISLIDAIKSLFA
ncbi:uncharacterized protein YpuA (DUF1002 family) [Peribacillus deserti]|uniref:Uncharacterized protein YpuA (DUF1002 family) n=1 Tax=Peribacillus deserti TaxID=673318 RepID=A0ABS2QL39_9BACI|nr:DUF1002 domain-containing protein [Peribacillus deserti]MBM7693173.1 uncharacterized protein YpuA (DUF1002 family) [Peribacillus deserti]